METHYFRVTIELDEAVRPLFGGREGISRLFPVGTDTTDAIVRLYNTEMQDGQPRRRLWTAEAGGDLWFAFDDPDTGEQLAERGGTYDMQYL